ncbi:hypothetical protein FOC34_20275 [Burkholderia multivorans]|uniref:hypothetical protein n=1 Tax=Burkholderia multivorans TaxID=87883 RepID=UPI0012DDCE90|nr:hypothetical protein [Burkholderia multivorans]QGR87530.1 hypothetical protein FOC34_20275 [Burkholderia multivorans]
MEYEISVWIRDSIKRDPPHISITRNFSFKSIAYANASHFHSHRFVTLLLQIATAAAAAGRLKTKEPRASTARGSSA